MRHAFPLTLAVSLLMATFSVPERQAQAQDATSGSADEKPNVVLILADNVGYGDLGPYGGGELRGAPTLRIDELGRECGSPNFWSNPPARQRGRR
jgi:hypothetical protein